MKPQSPGKSKPLVAGALLLSAVPALACPGVAGENGEAPPAPPASTSPVNPSPAAATTAKSKKPHVVEQLETLVQDLEMPSETDAPIRVFWTGEGVDEPKAPDYARMAGLKLKGDEPVEMSSLADLLDQAATEEKWMNEDEKKLARRFADLRAFLNANFAELEVLSWGTTSKQIVVVGRVEGGFAGIVTLVVET